MSGIAMASTGAFGTSGGGGTPTITSVSPSSFTNGTTGIVITGTNFESSQGAGVVKISHDDNITGSYNPRTIGAGLQVVTNTGGATLSPAYPTGYTAAAGDVCVVIIAGRPSGSTITNTVSGTAGYNLKGSQFLEIGAGATDLWIGVYTRVLNASEAAPTVTPDADFLPGSTTGGVSAQILILRDVTETLDVAAATNTSAAAATWTPPSVTTSSVNCMIISAVATADDNAINFNTQSDFSADMIGSGYDTTTGSDHAIAVGSLLKVAAGAVTMPVWNQSVVGNDVWAGVTLAFQPVSRYGAISQTVTAWSDTSITITAVRSTLLGGRNYVFVTNNTGLSNAAGSAVSLPIDVDALIDLNGTTAGTQLTAAIWNTGTRKGADWTGTGSTGGWTGTASTALVAAATANSLRSAFRVNTTVFDSTNASLRVKIDNNAAFTQHFVDISGFEKRNVTIAGFVTFGQTDTGASSALYDVVQPQGGITGGSVILQLDTKQIGGVANQYDVNVETTGGSTQHSSHITIVKDTTYWFSLRWSNSGLGSLMMFNASTGAQVGSTVSVSQPVGEYIGLINFGHGEGGTQATFMYLENIVIDYTYAIQPLGP